MLYKKCYTTACLTGYNKSYDWKEWPWPLGLWLILGIWPFVNRGQPNWSHKWSFYNVFCCMFMPHLALLLVRIEYSYIQLFVERFLFTLTSFMGMAPPFFTLIPCMHFWGKRVWSFEAAVTFPVRSVLGLVVYLSSPRHDIRPTAGATFPKTNSCSNCNISILSEH